MSGVKRRERRSVVRSNLHVIQPEIIPQQKNKIKNIVDKSLNSEANSKNSKANKFKQEVATVSEENVDAEVKTASTVELSKPANKVASTVEKNKATFTKDRSANIKPHQNKVIRIPHNYYLSNFLELQQFESDLQEVNQPKKTIKDEKFLSKFIKFKYPPGKKLSMPSATNRTVDPVLQYKKKLKESKLSYMKAKSKATLESHGKIPLTKEAYNKSEFATEKQSKFKERPGSSKDLKEKDYYAEAERWSSRHGLVYKHREESRDRSRHSREYSSQSSDDQHYKDKISKYRTKKYHDWEEREAYYREKYERRSEDYAYKEGDEYDAYKKGEKPHSFIESYDLSRKKEDLHVIPSTNHDFKVPVHFRKCFIRYLPYLTYSYFRPKWYFLSRKRYLANCRLASRKKAVTGESQNKIVKTPLKIIGKSQEPDKEMQEAESDNVETVVDDSGREHLQDESSIINDGKHEFSIIDGGKDESSIIDDRQDKSTIINVHDTLVDNCGEGTDSEEVTVIEAASEDKIKAEIIDLSDDTIEDTADDDCITETVCASDNIEEIESPPKSENANKEKNNEVTEKKPNELVDLEDDSMQEETEEVTNETESPLFQKCVSSLEFSPEFNQGDVAMQDRLNEWNSHLIGLEYMLEIQDNDEKVVKKYYCGLCEEAFPFGKDIEQIVINHIISYKHMCGYMVS